MRYPASLRANDFTLIELLVVVAIIAILASLLLPVLAKARVMSKKSACVSNLRQIMLGHNLYADEHDGWYPVTNWPTQALLGMESTDDIGAYYASGDGRVFLCPDSKFLGPGNSAYRPPRQLWFGYRERITNYKFAGGHNRSTQSWQFYGIHIGGSVSYRDDNRLATCVPSDRFYGSVQTDPDNGREVYIHPPEMMPMILDGMSLSNIKWATYASGHENGNNHETLYGINVMFGDGHVQWAPQAGGERRLNLYSSGGWLRW